MHGDILVIQEKHHRAAAQLFCLIRDKMDGWQGKFIVTIGGESGAGKSELAAALAELFIAVGVKTLIIQQDDFFRFPPLTNARKRAEDFDHVGPGEVRIDLLNLLVSQIRAGAHSIRKPLVIFKEDRISEEVLDIEAFRVIIIEGTYVTLLDGVDCRVFIDRDHKDTRADRLSRNREAQDGFLERILEKEHQLISPHKGDSDIIINRESDAIINEECR